MSLALDLLASARPRQWVKNLLVFLAFFFTVNLYWKPGDLAQMEGLLGRTLLAFIVFCLLSSSEYLVNDVLDRERDLAHPRKRHRPIAAGRVQPTLALGVAAGLTAVSLLLSLSLGRAFFLTGAGYLLLMLAYSLFLKHLVLIDLLTIAAGFVLRAAAGAVAIAVPISPWLYLCTVLAALFLGLGKRRQELQALQADSIGPGQHRPTLNHYSPRLVDELIAVVAPATVMAYSLYTFSAANLPANHAMMLTIPFALYAVFRYLFLVHEKNLGGSPEEVLLTDPPLIATFALWLLAAIAILSIFR